MGLAFVFPSDLRAWDLQEVGYRSMMEGNYERAVDFLFEALKYAPHDARTHWNLGFSLLALGNYVQGFEHIEWRWEVFDWCWGYLSKDIYRIKNVPVWQGGPLIGKRLLLYHEQGYGDAIMMSRYIPVLRRLGAVITLMTVVPLARLMADNFEIDVVTALPDDLSVFDCRCAIFDPMRRLDQTVLTVPREAYIKADFDPISKAMGIVWSGQSQKKYSATEFVRNLNHDGYKLYALQPYNPVDGIETLKARDFTDTLDVIRRMQHVVSVDTSVVHLAAACGHPSVHLLLPQTPEWRWYHSYAWYPALHVHRDWQSLNEAISEI